MLSQWGRWGKFLSYNIFLKTLIEGTVTTDAGSLFQYFTTLTENAGQPEVIATAVSLQRSALYLNDQQCKCLAVAIIRADGRISHRPKTFLEILTEWTQTVETR